MQTTVDNVHICERCTRVNTVHTVDNVNTVINARMVTSGHCPQAYMCTSVHHAYSKSMWTMGTIAVKNGHTSSSGVAPSAS